jgi:hypothetical protein
MSTADEPSLGEFQTATHALTGIVSAIRRVIDSSTMDSEEIRNEVANLAAAGECILAGLRDRF